MTNPWLERRVIAFAHQGGSFEGPSSTLWAIEHALAQGATAIELDVHATKDRTIVVCHDDTVDRTTAHAGAIADLTRRELAEMDNAYWWSPGAAVSPGLAPGDYPLRGRAPRDQRFGVATLEDVARTAPGVLLNLDIKQTDPDVEPYEQLLIDELRRLELSDSVIVASFHDRAIERFRILAPDVATSGATGETTTFYFSMLEGAAVIPAAHALQVPASYDGVEVVNAAFVEAAHRGGLAVHVWTINDVDEMDRLLDLGVDGIITDTPTPLAQRLRKRGCQWDGAL